MRKRFKIESNEAFANNRWQKQSDQNVVAPIKQKPRNDEIQNSIHIFTIMFILMLVRHFFYFILFWVLGRKRFANKSPHLPMFHSAWHSLPLLSRKRIQHVLWIFQPILFVFNDSIYRIWHIHLVTGKVASTQIWLSHIIHSIRHDIAESAGLKFVMQSIPNTYALKLCIFVEQFPHTV